MNAIETAYREATPASAAMFERARRSLAGGVSRQTSYWAPYPITVAAGEGAFIRDLDGRRYFDLTGNFTSLVHGHGYPPVREAAERAIAAGTQWSAGSVAMVELAEAMLARTPTVARLRFTNSGSEAASLAMTIARALTGRHAILMARGGYHGSVHEFETGTHGREGPATLLADYGDLPSFEAALEAHGPRIAAVFLEPVMGAGGVVAGRPDFLAGVAEAARKAGALFVLDEVITYRLGTGGCAGALGLAPDLTLFAKLIGGGFPVGAVGGTEAAMAAFDPQAMKVLHGGTYNGNPVTMACGAVAVRELTAERIDRMAALAERLEAGAHAAARRCGLPLRVHRAGSLLNLYLSQADRLSTATRDDRAAIALLHLACLNHGLFIASRGMIALATVLGEAEIDEIVEHLGRALHDVAAALAPAR
jgi:glutamate-1-semialdehyde 2,1-aminomutase